MRRSSCIAWLASSAGRVDGRPPAREHRQRAGAGRAHHRGYSRAGLRLRRSPCRRPAPSLPRAAWRLRRGRLPRAPPPARSERSRRAAAPAPAGAGRPRSRPPARRRRAGRARDRRSTSSAPSPASGADEQDQARRTLPFGLDRVGELQRGVQPAQRLQQQRRGPWLSVAADDRHPRARGSAASSGALKIASSCASERTRRSSRLTMKTAIAASRMPEHEAEDRVLFRLGGDQSRGLGLWRG